MPVIAESISLPNLTSAKLLSESLVQTFKKNDKDNLDIHASPTLKQVMSAEIDYVTARSSVHLTNIPFKPRYIQLKPNQEPTNGNYQVLSNYIFMLNYAILLYAIILSQ